MGVGLSGLGGGLRFPNLDYNLSWHSEYEADTIRKLFLGVYQVKTQWEPTLQNKQMIGCVNDLKKKKVTVKPFLGGKSKRHLHTGSAASDWM